MDGKYDYSRRFILNMFNMAVYDNCRCDSDENDDPNNSGGGDEQSSGSYIGTPWLDHMHYLWVAIHLTHSAMGLHVEPL